MKKILDNIPKYFPLSIKDTIIFFLSMGIGIIISVTLQKIITTDTHVPIIFVLIVLIIALTTNGYFYGTLAALLSVFAVNYAFTYPYYKLDFTIYGYPLTFITMLAVGLAASTLAARHKEIEKLKAETENERIRSTLLRSISHDLRTPLTTISGSLSAIIENANMKPDLRNELLINAKNDADWLYSIVENMLSVTKVSDERSIVKREELIEEVISEAVVKFKKNNKNIYIEITGTDEPDFIPMDAMLIEQVIINLLENSKTHGKANKIIISVKNICKNEVGIYIKDNGIGIKHNLLNHLFDGSLELNGNDKNRFMGIGLAVCQAIVKAHGGKISAHNPTNGGAEFMFTIPRGNTDDKN